MLGSILITISSRGPIPSPVRNENPRRYPNRICLFFPLSGVPNRAKISPIVPSVDKNPACKIEVYKCT